MHFKNGHMRYDRPKSSRQLRSKEDGSGDDNDDDLS